MSVESPDCLFRPEDKALKMLFPSVEDNLPSSFDEYLNAEHSTPSEHSDSELYHTIEDFFKNEAIDFDKKSPVDNVRARDRTPPQPWRKGLWCLNGSSTGELVMPKTRRTENQSQAIMPAHPHRSGEERTHRSAMSPDTRLQLRTKEYPITPETAPYRPDVTREITLSPTPMYASLPMSGLVGHHDSWQQDFEKFGLQRSPDQLAFSPRTAGFPTHHNHAAHQMNVASMAHRGAIPLPQAHYRHAEHRSRDPGLVDTYVTTQGQEVHYDQMPPQPQFIQHNREGIVWAAESIHSSNSNSSHPSTVPSSHHSYEIVANQAVAYPHGRWFSPSVQGQGHSPISPQAYYPTLAAPRPQRAPHQILQQSPSGLGIHYPPVEQIGQAIPYHAPNHLHEHYPVTHDSLPKSLYPPLPALAHHTFSEESPFTSPRRHVTSPQRSPSPLSPTATTPRSIRHRSPTRQDQHRRKSIHKNGPIKSSSEEPMPTMSKRTRSSSRPARTAKTPRTPTSPGKIDFVNYTEKDSRKLLSDVAPSGSSKTRAKREAEAKEMRKRLSEAANIAVRKAGIRLNVEELEELKRAIRA